MATTYTKEQIADLVDGRLPFETAHRMLSLPKTMTGSKNTWRFCKSEWNGKTKLYCLGVLIYILYKN